MLQKIKRKTAYFLILLFTFFSFPLIEATASEEKSPSLETTAKAAIIMEASTGQVIFSKNPDQELPMASVTKLMTLLLAVEAVERGELSLDEMVTASEIACSMGGSQIYLEPGESFSFKEMLISIAVGSANDASVAVAEHLGGSLEGFVDEMNQRAKELGLKHTHYQNPTGLPIENHYSSAHDLAIILQTCIKYPLFKEVSGIYEYDLRGGDFKLWSTNKLLKWYEGVDAGKTGWTQEAQYCLASTCEREGLRFITVVLGTEETRSHFRESIKLYNYGFAKYKALIIADKGEKLQTIKVTKGIKEELSLELKEKLVILCAKGNEEGYTAKIEAPKKLEAPIKKGEEIGFYIAMEKEKEIFRVPLIASEEIKKASFIQHMGDIFEELYQIN